jgi:hypothetical protein
MNLINKVRMNVRGRLKPNVHYFADHCDADTTQVLSEIASAKSFSQDMYDVVLEAAPAAVHIDGVVDHGLFTASTELFYDDTNLPARPNILSPEDVFDRLRRTTGGEDDPSITYTTASTYDGKLHHTHNTISISHSEITDHETQLPRPNQSRLVRGMRGFPTTTTSHYHS